MSGDGMTDTSPPQEGMRLTRTLPSDATDTQVVDAVNQVTDQLAAQADADDDPATRREDVRVVVTRGADRSTVVTGFLDAVPVAPYLEPGFDPFEGVPDDLRAQLRDDPPAPLPDIAALAPDSPATGPEAPAGGGRS